jgi:hypothetical protein
MSNGWVEPTSPIQIERHLVLANIFAGEQEAASGKAVLHRVDGDFRLARLAPRAGGPGLGGEPLHVGAEHLDVGEDHATVSVPVHRVGRMRWPAQTLPNERPELPSRRCQEGSRLAVRCP